jgi:hypothetical protein
MPTNSPSASQEVLEHHWNQHLAECPDAELCDIPCPDDYLVVRLCTVCHLVIFMLVDTGPPCEHARRLYDEIAGWGREV